MINSSMADNYLHLAAAVMVCAFEDPNAGDLGGRDDPKRNGMETDG